MQNPPQYFSNKKKTLQFSGSLLAIKLIKLTELCNSHQVSRSRLNSDANINPKLQHINFQSYTRKK